MFVYDALSRLTDATGNYGTVSYGYDVVGNRISRTQNNRIEDYTYAETSNRLLSVISESEQGELTTRTLGYDAVGNITADSADLNAKILGFGANNRLEQVSVNTGSNNTIAAYQYNAKGQRVRKQVDGKTIHFHYDTENRLLAETTESGAPIREYIYSANQRIALVDYQQNTQGVVYFMVNDHLGTPQLLLDAQQQVVWSVDQSPFGEVKVDGNIEQPLRFPGQYADAETGYSYNYFRDYDPTLGRYIESDPIGLEAGVNTFGYVMGNPVIGFDLWGLDGSNYGGTVKLFGEGVTATVSLRYPGVTYERRDLQFKVGLAPGSVSSWLIKTFNPESPLNNLSAGLMVGKATFNIGYDAGSSQGGMNLNQDLSVGYWLLGGTATYQDLLSGPTSGMPNSYELNFGPQLGMSMNPEFEFTLSTREVYDRICK